MIELLQGNSHWFWLSLGGLLLAAEMLGASGYLLWSGLSAMLTGVLTWLLPLDWAWQSVSFALLTIITALLWWHWLRQRSRKEPISTLNQRGRQLLGRHATLTEPLVNGIGRIDIGDSSWRVQAERDLPAGTVVEIVDVEGITLKVKPNA
ncbi:NfeD family protein [Musicola paradisiaca]|uniref:NfeD-like C-terminal domain-containing protein n=3 Tax=Musicola paradisiaca TaxID=69223 RepID=C6CBQ3_MUSP7|nr:NfeD family protein [Musicola paradisiaca]ACS84838.1 protein of unknown function DUF107 [Musicola paradisiaca Ech703]